MGHEFSGRVTEVGDGVTRVKPGDRVVVEPIIICGRCRFCTSGRYNICEKRAFHGASGKDGAFSCYSVVQERQAHKIPDSISFEQGALVEPAAVALHAVRSSSLKVGDRVAVFGAGAVGLMVIEAARIAGAGQIHVVETSPQRRARALELGADTAIDPFAEDPVARIHALTEGGADIAFELSGAPPVLQQAILATHNGAEITVISIWEQPATINPNTIVSYERTVRGILAYRDNFPAVIDLMMKGHFTADKLVTKKIPLANLIEDGFEELVRDKKHIKILVEPPV
jgi:(R,R)-butanediol dehydrogenase/meso-butanediol dehydrogenase/diacetyl reductase